MAKMIGIDYSEDLKLPIQSIQTALQDGADLLCIPNPDSPTGTIIAPDILESLIAMAQSRGTVVLIDEAYFPFYPQSVLYLIPKYDNLIVTRTLAKAWAAAGARVGYAVTNPELCSILHSQKSMYEIGTLGALLAEVVIDHAKDVEDAIARTLRVKDQFCTALESKGFRVFRGHSNFIHVDFGVNKAKIIDALQRSEVLFKARFNDPCLKGFSRFTIGSEAMMNTVQTIILQNL